MNLLSLSDTSEAEGVLDTAKQAIDAADDVLLFYSKMIRDIGLPKTADELVSELKELHLPTEDAFLVNDMKTKLGSVTLTEYESAAQDINESFKSASAQLRLYIRLFDVTGDSKFSSQKTILLTALDAVISPSNGTQIKLNKTSSEFKAAIEKVDVLQARYKSRSDGKSESIKSVCDRLKDRFNKISNDIDESNEQFKSKIKIIDDLKSRVEGTTLNPTTNDYAELRDSLIESVQKLFADYTNYSQNL